MKTNHNQNKQKLSRKKRLRNQIERKKKQKRGGKQGLFIIFSLTHSPSHG